MAKTTISGPLCVTNGIQAGAEGSISRVAKFEINAAPDGSIQNTDIVLPAKAVLRYWLIDVRVAEATGATPELNLGALAVGNDELCAAQDVGTTGLKKPTLQTPVDNIGGSLLATDSGAVSHFEPSVALGGDTITYQAESNDWVEFRGDIYIFYDEIE